MLSSNNKFKVSVGKVPDEKPDMNIVKFLFHAKQTAMYIYILSITQKPHD